MEITHSWMFMLIVLCIRNTEAPPPGHTERANSHYSVKEDQKALPSLQKGTQSAIKNISGLRGESVTLPVVDVKESEIQDIQWVKNGINFATTKPDKGVTIRDSNYNGRLSSSNDGSLVIHKITMDDQGEYKADIYMLSSKKHEIIYQLHISEEKGSSGKSAVAAVVSIIVVLLVVVAGVAFMMWKKKKMCFQDSVKATPEATRYEPEGKSETEKEALQKKESSPNLHDPHDDTNDDDDEWVMAPGTLEEMKYYHTLNNQENKSQNILSQESNMPNPT